MLGTFVAGFDLGEDVTATREPRVIPEVQEEYPEVGHQIRSLVSSEVVRRHHYRYLRVVVE